MAAHVKRADAFGPVHLVGAERHQVDVIGLHIHRDLAEGLHGVAVEENVFFAADFTDLAHRLDDADLVVCVHDADQHGVGGNRVAQFVQVQPAIWPRLEDGDATTRPGKPVGGVQDSFVLGGHGHEVRAAHAGGGDNLPLIARLSDSVAPLVKTISCGAALA